MDPVKLLAILGGVAERATLVGRHRASAGALAQAVEEGRVLRVRRGCYALPGADSVRVAQVAWRAVPTCLTAARALGLPVLSNDQRLHLLFSSSRSFSGRNLRPPSSIRGHFTTESLRDPLAASDVVDAAAACLIQVHQLVLLDAALHRGLVLLSDVQNFQVTPKRRVEWLIRYADPRCESPLETLLRFAMRRAGLHVQSQVVIEGVGRVDFLVEGVVIVEADGRAFHSDSVAFAADRRRDRAAAARGYVPMRFTYAEILADADALAAEVGAVSVLVKRGRAKSRLLRHKEIW